MMYKLENVGRAMITVVAMALALMVLPSAAQAGEILVPLDESVVHIFDQDVATVAVGNPSIADVTVHNGRVLLVIGRSFGTTNVIVLDSEGKPIGSKRIRVTSVGGGSNVTVLKGDQNKIISFSCAPRCERILVPGDEALVPKEFDKLLGQNAGKAQLASGETEESEE